ncbi:MAG TPA: PPC domain-containing protein, partial [Asticcacaulis sp.]|nr:PPC domain-containing protein [Asticcacaulis sp.]
MKTVDDSSLDISGLPRDYDLVSRTNSGRAAMEKAGSANPHGATELETSGSDSIPADITTGASLLPGVPVNAFMNGFNDHDWFKVTLTAGQTYDFTMNAGSKKGALSTDCHVTLHDGNGALIATGVEGGFGDDSVLTFTATTSGTYYLSAETLSGSSTGGYTVAMSAGYVPALDNIADNISTSGGITVGQTLTGNLETPGDHDWYKIDMTYGQGYDIALINNGDGTFQDPIIHIYDQYGQEVAYDDDGGLNHNSLLHFTPAASGTYYIEASAFADGQHGTYNLS